jgi:DNA-directed RNA polymerase subunit H
LGKQTIEERKAQSLIELRDYELLKRDEEENAIRFTVKTDKKKKAIISCILNRRVVGVAFVRKLQKRLEEAKVSKGIMIANVRYTWAAKREARKNGIELIPRRFPPFNIFKHELVPKHEILPPEEAKELLEKYHIEAHQLPAIKSSDVAVIGIGAKLGDIIKITRESPTAGEHIAYRLVIIDPKAKVKL